MRLLGLKTICPKPRTIRARSEHRVYPYLLRGLKIDEPSTVQGKNLTCHRGRLSASIHITLGGKATRF